MRPLDWDTVRALYATPFHAIVAGLFLLVGFLHLQQGIQVVIEDYVHTRGTEITLHLANTFLCAVGALASLYAIGRIALLG